MRSLITCSTLALLAAGNVALAQGDPAVIDKIIEEGTNNNKIWEHLEHLSYEIGPRLTGSTNLAEANAWTREQFASWGLKNAHLMKWGEIPVRFDRGPSYAKMVEPMEKDFEFSTNSWSRGTDGPVRGIVLKAPANEEEYEAIKDKVAGAWILSKGRTSQRRRGVVQTESIPAVPEEIGQKLIEAGIAGVLVPARNELVITRSERGWRELTMDTIPDGVTVQIRRSDYDSMNSRIADGEEVVVEVDLQNHFSEGPFPLFNTIAEIPGTVLPEEVVIVSGHLDSWDGPGSLGSQDNGTGTCITLEAARLLMAAGARPHRTIRFVLWTGEEQGLLGSRGYLESLSEEERAKISAVLVDDGGTNYEGGLNCIEPQAEMLREATAKINEVFPDMPVEIHVHKRMPQGGGSDHATFNRVGIPGYFWDESGKGGREGKNYTFIHHTQHDTPRYAVPEYLVQSSVASAITAYNLAMADSMLPREIVDNGYTESELASWDTVQTPVSGSWDYQITYRRTRTFDITITFDVSSDGRVKGISTSSFGGNESKIIRGSWDEATKTVTALVRSGWGDSDFKAVLQDDGTLKGSYSFGRGEQDFTATRKVEEEVEEEAEAEAEEETEDIAAATGDATDASEEK